MSMRRSLTWTGPKVPTVEAINASAPTERQTLAINAVTMHGRK